MGESLRKVSQGLAAMPGLFRKEADMVGEAEHPLENQSRLLEPRPVVAAGSGQRLDQPKRADVEGAFLSRQPIHGILDIVSVHQAVGGQTCFANGSSVASNVVSMRGSAGDMKKVSAIIRLAASNDSLP